MKLCAFCLAVLVAVCTIAVPGDRAEAQLTPAHRRELADIRRDVSKAGSLVRRKDLDEAETLLDEAESRLKKVAEEAKLDADDRAVAAYTRQIELQRALIQKQRMAMPGEKGEAGEKDGRQNGAVSFSKDVAPILVKNCVDCHSDNPGGGLRLDTFAGMEKGGAKGPLLFVGVPARSLIIQRLAAQPPARMPKDKPPLAKTEIETIALWIAQGAKFDGADTEKTTALRELAAASKPKPAVEIPKPEGDETVSFTKDIAPWFVNLCLNCHGERNPRSGFSVATFEKILEGGDSGRVLLPGNLDGSRLWDLVGKQDPIKMPAGQARITRQNWNDLKTWIEEGAKFDGKDAKTPLRDLVPTDAEMKAADLAKLTPEQWLENRKERSEELFKRVLPNDTPRWVESEEFLVYGNVSEARLQEIDKWAEEYTKSLKSMFNEKATPLWKGKLTIFVMKDRFGYEEFNLIVNRRDTPRDITAHAVVTPTYEDAYVALQDVGDTVTSESPGLRVNLVDQLTGAFLQRSGNRLPDWVIRGTGLAMASRVDAQNSFLQSLKGIAVEELKSLDRPEAVFADGTFSPSGVNAVGYTLVEFMLTRGGPAKFGQFIGSLQNGTTVAAAMQSIYQSTPNAVARAYFAGLGRGR